MSSDRQGKLYGRLMHILLLHFLTLIKLLMMHTFSLKRIIKVLSRPTSTFRLQRTVALRWICAVPPSPAVADASAARVVFPGARVLHSRRAGGWSGGPCY